MSDPMQRFQIGLLLTAAVIGAAALLSAGADPDLAETRPWLALGEARVADGRAGAEVVRADHPLSLATPAEAEPAPNPEPTVAPAPEADPLPTTPYRPSEGPAFAILALEPEARTALYTEASDEPYAGIGPATEFGSRVILGVVERRGPWFGVLNPVLPNGVVGWIRFDPSRMSLQWTQYSLHTDLSERTLELRHAGEVLSTHLVTVGGLGSETPTGRFAVTDALNFGTSPYYGCCALALSGHQPALPPGWLGGDRIAIHGTPGRVGYAESHGCLRATDETMRELFATVPLGVPVFVEP